jgi:hypothetical protein
MKPAKKEPIKHRISPGLARLAHREHGNGRRQAGTTDEIGGRPRRHPPARFSSVTAESKSSSHHHATGSATSRQRDAC